MTDSVGRCVPGFKKPSTAVPLSGRESAHSSKDGTGISTSLRIVATSFPPLFLRVARPSVPPPLHRPAILIRSGIGHMNYSNAQCLTLCLTQGPPQLKI